SLAAFKRNAVYGTVEVDNNCVAVLGCFFIDNNEFSMTLLQTLKLLVDFFFSYLHRLYRHFEAFIVAKRNFRFNSYFRFELKWLSFSKLLYVHFRTVHRENIRLFNRFSVHFRKQDIDCVLIKGFNAETRFKDRPWYFTFAESRYVCFLYHFLKRFI